MKQETEIVHNASQLSLGTTAMNMLLRLHHKHMLQRCLISAQQMEVAWEFSGYSIVALFDFTTKAIDITSYLPDISGATRSGRDMITFPSSEIMTIPKILNDHVHALEAKRKMDSS